MYIFYLFWAYNEKLNGKFCKFMSVIFMLKISKSLM